MTVEEARAIGRGMGMIVKIYSGKPAERAAIRQAFLSVLQELDLHEDLEQEVRDFYWQEIVP